MFVADDVLFRSDSQIREKKAVWRFFQSHKFSALCNDWWNWFGLNIPMNILDNDFEGDIDIIVSRPDLQLGKEANFEVPFYRVFEVKTATLNLNGETKSLKINKIKKILGQLKKLADLGCPNIFLFDLFVVENGFSNVNNFPTPEVIDYLRQKQSQLMRYNYGYVFSALEYIPSENEYLSGVEHPIHNICVPSPSKEKGSFEKITNYINDFYQEEKTKNRRGYMGAPLISYCVFCKKLVLKYSQEEFVCNYCQSSLFN